MNARRETLGAVGVAVMFSVVSRSGQAAAPARVYLSTPQAAIEVEGRTTVDVLVGEAPLIYGADVRVRFDPGALEVVDADRGSSGVQIEPGSFLDPRRSFSLLHAVDNQAGSVSFASTLVNPAPAVQGAGTLARLTFRAKRAGSTTVAIEKGELGTLKGETIRTASHGRLTVRIREKQEGALPREPSQIGVAVRRVVAVLPGGGSGGRTGLLLACAATLSVLIGWLMYRKWHKN